MIPLLCECDDWSCRRHLTAPVELIRAISAGRAGRYLIADGCPHLPQGATLVENHPEWGFRVYQVNPLPTGEPHE